MSSFIYATNCPHCKVQKASFTGWAILATESETESRAPLSCPHCHEVVVFKVMHRAGFRDAFHQYDEKYNLNSRDSGIYLMGHYPTGTVHSAPADVPERIGKFFIEAQENLVGGKFETCILLCGKVLDIATKGLDQTWSLERRLKKLATDGKITADMADWAEEIRLDRNEAAHADEDFDKDDASEIMGFTQAFLNYVYTLPALVEDRRTKREIQKLLE